MASIVVFNYLLSIEVQHHVGIQVLFNKSWIGLNQKPCTMHSLYRFNALTNTWFEMLTLSTCNVHASMNCLSSLKFNFLTLYSRLCKA